MAKVKPFSGIRLIRKKKVLVDDGLFLRVEAAATINTNGEILLFKSEEWKSLSFEEIIKVINHETEHLAIGELEGWKTLDCYDKLFTDSKFCDIDDYSLDRLTEETNG